MKLVSIIVPVFNVETYLDMCIANLTAQTYKNIEIILINDGSTDKSGVICDEWQKKDDRISVFHQQNSGVSVARNRGIKEAKGYYIVFADSDDLYEKEFVELSVKKMEDNKTEYLSSAFCILENGFKKKIVDYLYNYGELITIDEYLNVMFQYQAGAYWGANWGKLFLRQIIIDNGILFEENIQFAEDFRFNLEYLKYVKHISILHDSSYQYRIDTICSLSKKKRNPFKYWEEYRELFYRYKELCKFKRLYDKYKNKIEVFAVRAGIIVLRDCIRSNSYSTAEIEKIASHIIRSYEFVPQKTKKMEIALFNRAYKKQKVRELIIFLKILEKRLDIKKRRGDK